MADALHFVQTHANDMLSRWFGIKTMSETHAKTRFKWGAKILEYFYTSFAKLYFVTLVPLMQNKNACLKYTNPQPMQRVQGVCSASIDFQSTYSCLICVQNAFVLTEVFVIRNSRNER